jgi:hypothetical protein
MASRPAPAFSVGQRVRVILNERNRTARVGTILGIMWHFKDGRYNYYLEEGGKKVSKRYFQEDLEAVPQMDEQAKPVPQALEGQMTEAEWLGCEDPRKMLEFLRGTVSERKLRLFACACFRRLWHLLEVDAARWLVELSEAYADGEVSAAELQAANDPAASADFDDRFHGRAEPRLSIRAGNAILALKWLASPTFDTGAASSVAVFTSKDPARDYFREPDWEGHPAGVPPSATERAEQATLLRDIVRNPFRPLPVVPASVLSWNDGCVVKLATAVYEGREFTPERMGVLADALEDAGLKDEEVLRHCRQEGVHVRGCWVVDLLLGKS